MAKNPETIIQQEIIDYLNSRRIFHFRVNADMNTVGIPDLIVCYRGLFVGFEIKTENGKASKIQKEVANEIRCNGGFVFNPTSVQDIKDAFKFVDKSISLVEQGFKWD